MNSSSNRNYKNNKREEILWVQKFEGNLVNKELCEYTILLFMDHHLTEINVIEFLKSNKRARVLD